MLFRCPIVLRPIDLDCDCACIHSAHAQIYGSRHVSVSLSRTRNLPSTIYIPHLLTCRAVSRLLVIRRSSTHDVLRRTPGLRLASLPIPVASPVAFAFSRLWTYSHTPASRLVSPVCPTVHSLPSAAIRVTSAPSLCICPTVCRYTCHPLPHPQAPTADAAAAHDGGQAARGARGKELPPEVLDIPRRRAARSRCVELFFSFYLCFWLVCSVSKTVQVYSTHARPSPSRCRGSLLRVESTVPRAAWRVPVSGSRGRQVTYALIFETNLATAATRVSLQSFFLALPVCLAGLFVSFRLQAFYPTQVRARLLRVESPVPRAACLVEHFDFRI